MVHGGAGHVQRERCWPNSRYAGDSATLAPLLLGVVPPGGADSSSAPKPDGKRPRRSGDTQDQPSLSYILFHRCPASLQSVSEKFSKLSHRCPGTRGKSRRRTAQLQDAQN